MTTITYINFTLEKPNLGRNIRGWHVGKKERCVFPFSTTTLGKWVVKAKRSWEVGEKSKEVWMEA